MKMKILALLVAAAAAAAAPFHYVFLPLIDLVPAMIFHRHYCSHHYFSLVVNPHPSMAIVTLIETTKKKKKTC
jgi:hypothetical protein